MGKRDGCAGEGKERETEADVDGNQQERLEREREIENYQVRRHKTGVRGGT